MWGRSVCLSLIWGPILGTPLLSTLGKTRVQWGLRESNSIAIQGTWVTATGRSQPPIQTPDVLLPLSWSFFWTLERLKAATRFRVAAFKSLYG